MKVFHKILVFFEGWLPLPGPNFFQTERTRWLAHLPSFCELVLKIIETPVQVERDFRRVELNCKEALLSQRTF